MCLNKGLVTHGLLNQEQRMLICSQKIRWLLFFESFRTTTIRERFGYQIGRIFGKILNGLRPPPLIFGKLCCKFLMRDMVVYMMAR